MRNTSPKTSRDLPREELHLNPALDPQGPAPRADVTPEMVQKGSERFRKAEALARGTQLRCGLEPLPHRCDSHITNCTHRSRVYAGLAQALWRAPGTPEVPMPHPARPGPGRQAVGGGAGLAHTLPSMLAMLQLHSVAP